MHSLAELPLKYQLSSLIYIAEKLYFTNCSSFFLGPICVQRGGEECFREGGGNAYNENFIQQTQKSAPERIRRACLIQMQGAKHQSDSAELSFTPRRCLLREAESYAYHGCRTEAHVNERFNRWILSTA